MSSCGVALISFPGPPGFLNVASRFSRAMLKKLGEGIGPRNLGTRLVLYNLPIPNLLCNQSEWCVHLIWNYPCIDHYVCTHQSSKSGIIIFLLLTGTKV